MRNALFALLLLPALANAADDGFHDAVDGSHRGPEDRARDVYRHPLETLSFCGLAPEQSVLEIWPGGGWYSNILAPTVRERGRYTAAIFGPHAPDGFRPELDAALRARFDAAPEVYGVPTIASLWYPEDMDIGAPASVDAVYTFRNLHNWLMGEYAPAVLAEIHRVLRPGGTFCVVDHRADARRPIDPMASSGYVDEGYAIQLITAAGFRLVAVADINDNPRDTSDHPRGVWTLPPSLAMGDTDREHYLEIGESDRFTLRFERIE